MSTRELQIRHLLDRAENGDRIIIIGGRKDKKTGEAKDQTIWGGLGNRAGLHSFAYTLMYEKWNKSGPRFVKKINALPAGTKLAVQDYCPTDRDRGRWVTRRRFDLIAA